MTMRAVLVDDEPLARERLRALLGGESDVEVVAECADGPAAVKALREFAPDFVFLDIRMPGMDGFEVLEALGSDRLPWVIFLTAYDEHAVRAFEAHALDYLLKPASRARVRESVARVRERMAAAAPPAGLREWLANRERARRLVVRDGPRVVFVELAAVDWIEAAGNYALIHVGRETHILRETMSELEARLPREEFLRVSRGAILNLDRVKELQTEAPGVYRAVLADGLRVAVTRAWREIEARLG
jgi:two-component system LytT family response regulator